MADVDAAGDVARLTGLPVARRAFARPVFAWMEGNAFFLRATLLTAPTAWGRRFRKVAAQLRPATIGC